MVGLTPHYESKNSKDNEQREGGREGGREREKERERGQLLSDMVESSVSDDGDDIYKHVPPYCFQKLHKYKTYCKIKLKKLKLNKM